MKTYREEAIEVVKICGQELIDRAEELIPDTTGIKDVDIWIRIPSKTDDPYVVPELEVSVNVYPKRVTIEKIFEIRNSKKGES